MLSNYAPGGTLSFRARLGITLVVLPVPDDVRMGLGAEFLIDFRLSRLVRVGGRVGGEKGERSSVRTPAGFETGEQALLTLGSRMSIGRHISLAVDLYRLEYVENGGVDDEVGVMFGLGLTGDLSQYFAVPAVAAMSYIGTQR